MSKYISENYVGVAGNDLDYVVTDAKDRFEYQHAQKIFAQSPYKDSQQGIWLATSSGELFTHYVGLDPDEALSVLKAGVQAYKSRSVEGRRLARKLTPADALPRYSRRPKEVIDIRVTKRTLPDARIPEQDQRHPQYYHFDYLWLKPSELKEFVPIKTKVGAKRSVAKHLVQRFALTNLLMPESQAWRLTDLAKGSIQTKITKVDADGIHLEMTGEFVLEANNKDNDAHYEGRLLGSLVVSSDRKQLLSFDAVALGDVDVRRLQSNLHFGPGDTRVGAVFKLNGNTPNDRMAPSGTLGYQNW